MIKIMTRKWAWWVVTFGIWLIWHTAHDMAWFFLGRFTSFEVERTIPAIIGVTLLMTLITRWRGKGLH